MPGAFEIFGEQNIASTDDGAGGFVKFRDVTAVELEAATQRQHQLLARRGVRQLWPLAPARFRQRRDRELDSQVAGVVKDVLVYEQLGEQADRAEPGLAHQR